ncbi:MAG: dihydrofolate reductase [Sulfurisoma sp.]|nr:dihydrofolate reductase [Sulfurisoma sp.]
MRSLTLIAALAKNGVIGSDNKLPWRLPEDMRHFKTLTAGHAVIMGRKTWESLPPKFRPLPGRHNIVVSRDSNYRAESASIAHSLDEAVTIAASGDVTPFVIGGAELYRQALPLAGRLELTEIAADFAGDAHFPEFDRAAWREVARETGHAAAGFDYAFVSYERTQST